MRDKWFGDNRDLVKWSVLLHLAKENNINNILQIAYYRESEFGSICIDYPDCTDDKVIQIPDEVKNFFRRIQNIKNMSNSIMIDVFD